jgi:hypothetical protein
MYHAFYVQHAFFSRKSCAFRDIKQKNKKQRTHQQCTLPQISSHPRFSLAIKVHAYMHYKSKKNERLYNNSQQDLAMNIFSDKEHGNTQFCFILT